MGGVDVWGEITVDEKRGIAYFPVSSPKYELYGGDRPGHNLFADCILALDARTGKYLWHFQTVHHDIWDYDPTAAPQLVTVKHDGKTVDVVALASKNGFLYVFDRVTGKPLWPIEERPVPKSEVPGEWTSPTQPFPIMPPPFARQRMTKDDLYFGFMTPAEKTHWEERFANAQNKDGFSGDVDRLFVSAAYANQGPSAKRVRPAPMGRAFRVLKRTAHLTVAVSERPEKVVRVGGADNRPKRPQGKKKSEVRSRKSEGAVQQSDAKAKE